MKKIALVLLFLLLATLACNTPTTRVPVTAPPTVTPFVAATEERPTATLSPEPVVGPTTEPTVQPTETVAPTVGPTARPTVAATATTRPPTVPPSAGPLDFQPPGWIDGYDPLPEGRYRVYVTIHISGGAPPFTVYQENQLVAESSLRDLQFNFERTGCAAIVYTIVVQSADGQRVSHDYWIGVDQQPWCRP